MAVSVYHIVTLCTMSFGTGVVVAVAFQQVNHAPHAQASAQSDHEDLQSFDRGSKKFHSVTWNRKLYENWGFYSTTFAKLGQKNRRIFPAVPVFRLLFPFIFNNYSMVFRFCNAVCQQGAALMGWIRSDMRVFPPTIKIAAD